MLTTEQPPKKLLDQVRDLLRIKHYSYRTEQSYVAWIRRYILFHNKRHPKEMGIPEIEAFLSYLAIKENVAASTQNVALSALIFLYKEVLRIDQPLSLNAFRAKRSTYLPTVLTKEETQSVIQQLTGEHQLVIKILYGSGLRLSEGINLRVKDLDFAQRQIQIRDTKGMESRITMMPDSIIESPKARLRRVKSQHQRDLAKGFGSAYLPFALARRFPHADRQWIWQYVFPSGRISKDPRGEVVRGIKT
jgi:integron integrase